MKISPEKTAQEVVDMVNDWAEGSGNEVYIAATSNDSDRIRAAVNATPEFLFAVISQLNKEELEGCVYKLLAKKTLSSHFSTVLTNS